MFLGGRCKAGWEGHIVTESSGSAGGTWPNLGRGKMATWGPRSLQRMQHANLLERSRATNLNNYPKSIIVPAREAAEQPSHLRGAPFEPRVHRGVRFSSEVFWTGKPIDSPIPPTPPPWRAVARTSNHPACNLPPAALLAYMGNFPPFDTSSPGQRHFNAAQLYYWPTLHAQSQRTRARQGPLL